MTPIEKLTVDLETRVTIASQLGKSYGVNIPDIATLRKNYEASIERLGVTATNEAWVMYIDGFADGLRVGNEIHKAAQAIDESNRRYAGRRVQTTSQGRHIGNLWGLLP